MSNCVHQYKWYLVGILKPIEYKTGEACDNVDSLSRRFIIYDSAIYWYDDLQECINDGANRRNIVSYPDSLGCNLIITVDSRPCQVNNEMGQI